MFRLEKTGKDDTLKLKEIDLSEKGIADMACLYLINHKIFDTPIGIMCTAVLGDQQLETHNFYRMTHWFGFIEGVWSEVTVGIVRVESRFIISGLNATTKTSYPKFEM